MPFFAGYAGKCARSIDEGDDGKAEAICQTHQAKGFSISFGMGTSEIAQEIFFCIPTFLVAEEDNALPVQGRQTSDERAIFAKGAVASEFEEFGSAMAQVVEQVRALRVANDLNALPRR